MQAKDIDMDKKKGFQLQVGDQIAQGSFSTTFLATTEPELSGNFSEVVKVGLKKHQLKYAKEKQVLHLVSGHTYFPRLVHAAESKKFTYIVTEYGGEDLKTVSERNRFGITSNRNVLRLAYRLHGAVDFLHSRNFFHRDIKAENVLIELRNRSIRVKLSDFGDASDIREPARRRSSFMKFFLPAALPPYCEAEDHCHTAVMCLKLLKNLPYIPRRRSVFLASHITEFPFPKLEGDHEWMMLIWLSLCGCYQNKTTEFGFIETFIDEASVNFDKRSDIDYCTITGKLRLDSPDD